MRTDDGRRAARAWCAFCALLVGAQCLAVGALPGFFAVLFLALCVASVTLLAWIATDGRHPTAVVAGAMLLAFLSARGQPEFLAGALAAFVTGSWLFKNGARACAESSQR